MNWFPTWFAQATATDPNILSQAAEKYGVIGVLSVICVVMALAIWKRELAMLDKDKQLIAAKDAQIAERDKRIETEREYGRYLKQIEAEHAKEVRGILEGQLDIADRTKDAMLALKDAIERDQRGRPP